MLNIENIEKLAKIRGKNLLSIYLNTDREKASLLNVETRAKDLIKNLDLNESSKKDILQKVLSFLEKCSSSTKSSAIFISENNLYYFVFPFAVEDSITQDYFFNLEPLFYILSENEKAGVFLIDNEEARFVSIFLGNFDEHHFIEDRIARKQKGGGWSQARFARQREEIIKAHLKNSVDFLIKMHKIYKFDILFLRSAPEIENKFINLLPEELKKKICGDIKVEINSSAKEIAEKVKELCSEEMQKEEKFLTEELRDMLKKERDKSRAINDLMPVLDAVYNDRAQMILLNRGLSKKGFYCKFCHYLSLDDEYCPYDETPNMRIKDVVEALTDEAVAKGVKVEIFDNDKTLKDLGDIAAFLKN